MFFDEIESINKVSSLNNAGAALIMSGRLADAVIMLGMGLAKLKEPVITMGSQVMKNNMDRYMRGTVHDQHDWDESITDDTQIPHRHKLPLYQTAISVPTTNDSRYGPRAVTMSKVILFNLALAHHLAGLVSEHSSSLLLAKAATLYETSFMMARKENMRAPFFTLAVVNNLGCIHHAMGDEGNAMMYFHQLLSMCMFLVDSPRVVNVGFEFDGFLNLAYQMVTSQSFRAVLAPAA